ncbi:MAG TPA: site-2 protease family protein [Spirochaetales bacterium]|nr:site-2 protease family protein [Spirochaetales bacterium]
MKILLGLIGLGIVVFIHEFGHFLAAKLLGIGVEVFSIGWGKRLFSFQYKGTEYRISLLPIGGFCKLKGEEAFNQNLSDEIGKDQLHPPDSFYAASPWKRIVVAFSGPAFNLVSAIVAFTLVWYMGFSYPTFSNRIILESDYPSGYSERFPAKEGGLQTGDEIIAINGTPIETYRDIQEIVSRSPGKPLTFTYRREGKIGEAVIIPDLNKDTGAGRIGVYAWIPPIIEEVRKDSSAYIAGLKKGDVILQVDGEEVPHTLAFLKKLSEARSRSVRITYEREGKIEETKLLPHYTETEVLDTGIIFRAIVHSVRSPSFPNALQKGWEETKSTLVETFRSLGLLFKGINLSKAVSGPIRITYYVGEIASQGFSKDISTGITSSLSFLALLSVTLFFMNLLPIPVLDGGLILMFLIELLIRRRLPTKFVYRYQYLGFIIILGLILLATMSDVLFFFRK